MEKKNLGRGLEDISNVFLSTGGKKEGGKPGNGFSAVTIREETCANCANMIEGSGKELKCRVFTFENEKYGVPHLDTITPNYANYCKHFLQTGSRDLVQAKEEGPAGALDRAEENCEIEENVTIQKKFAFPFNESSQMDMRKALSKYMEGGYNIKSIELFKTSKVSRQKRKETKKEEITIFIKEPESS